ncbi:hypothetical protein SEA_WALTZ_39 [Arthrobacter phage Waltz]|nr:hypothetical protein SEA_WALTZ_39 [Arthrobacter phage Waltz]
MPMDPIPAPFQQLDAKVVILNGDNIIRGVITKLAKTRVTVTTKRATMKDGEKVLEDHNRYFIAPYFRIKEGETPHLDEYGYRSSWNTTPKLYLADAPIVAKAREARKIKDMQSQLMAAIRGFERGNMSPARARALRGHLNHYIDGMTALENPAEPQTEGAPRNDDE